ncbi:MAG TPA: VCBS repeat-containing protein, partial [Saprospiraceae bacterium]|nr:VCBS repeat-containing protein [Saprospiraceae bacterium]
EKLGLDSVHRENDFVEFNREALIPHAVSTEGPALAVGDVNGDGLEDVYQGGARRQAGILNLQQPDGRFLPSVQPAFLQDSIWEDVDAAFFDADGDGDLDLFVASGGNEYNLGDAPTLPRLYLNDGKGNFERSLQALPKEVALTASSIAVNDFDNDGDMDLFLGARATPWRYGEVPRSFLLRNNGKGLFEDATDKAAPGLARIGFVKDAVWADFNGDRQADLLLACEWSAPRLLLNEKGKLNLLSDQQTGLGKHYGWWNTVITGDFDGDGDLDFIGGNLGRNTRLTASEKHPLTMYYEDFDDNGQPEQLLCYYYAGEMRLFATRDEIVKQLVSVKKKYLKHADFARAGLNDIFSKQQLRKAQKYVAHTLDSYYFENEGNGKFKPAALPADAQMAPIMAGFVGDFNADKRADAVLLGNFYECNIQMGRYDASYGALLLNKGAGTWAMPPMAQSGLALTGQFRRVQPLQLADGTRVWIAVRNNERPIVL